jgi:hypothetical protein
MLSILNLTKTNKLILSTFVFLTVMALGGGRAHAATLNVTGGCTLPIAINSVNAGANQSGCTASGSYGTDDTINIPAGTQTLTADLPTITVPVKVQGAGMSQTTISGDGGLYSTLQASGVAVEISNLMVTQYRTAAISTQDCDVQLRNIEVNGSQSVNEVNGQMYGIRLTSSSSNTKTVDTDGVYIHNLNSNSIYGLFVFLVQQFNGTITNANLKNTTLSDIHSTGPGGVNGFVMSVGLFGTVFGSSGTVNATITNTTIDNMTADGVSGPFVNGAYANGGNAIVNTNVYNATITNTDGPTGSFAPVVGVPSGAFYAVGAGLSSGNVGTANVNVGNSLLANNTTDGTTSNNCSTADITSGVGGAGTGASTITSLGHNISDDSSCTSFTQPGDQQNVSNILSTLGQLQNNGGNIPTRALLAGSPAIASGGAVLGVSTDARGIARPSTNPSVGAYQYVAGASTGTPSVAAGGGAIAPNTGVRSVSQALNILASVLGLGLLAYVFRKHQRQN